MGFVKKYFELSGLFNMEKDATTFEGSDNSILVFPFTSKYQNLFSEDSPNEVSGLQQLNQDSRIIENLNFNYPVFVPSGKKKYDNAIILLHGLNERSWDKYLAWAWYLCENTNKPVILFPISFHINRSPKEWCIPRAMQISLEHRKKKSENISMLSFANIALSERLTEFPQRFLNSGYQSAEDLIALIKQIKNGNHIIFNKSAGIDLFAYSIGSYLSQIMMLANPENLFDGSRLFMFCGGSLFSEMNGSSKLIMDSMAFDHLYDYYMNGIQKEMKTHGKLSRYLSLNSLGQAFLSMLAIDNLRSFRENAFLSLSERIHAIALLKDKVIPAKGIIETLKGKGLKYPKNVDVFDFPFQYTHEIPFPVRNSSITNLINQSFEMIFQKAVVFLK